MSSPDFCPTSVVHPPWPAASSPMWNPPGGMSFTKMSEGLQMSHFPSGLAKKRTCLCATKTGLKCPGTRGVSKGNPQHGWVVLASFKTNLQGPQEGALKKGTPPNQLYGWCSKTNHGWRFPMMGETHWLDAMSKIWKSCKRGLKCLTGNR